ncbi:MAG: universal stress protein [Desulfovermiculus sp.]|nr:universal stress protein [Desulfovermiculus sp.]
MKILVAYNIESGATERIIKNTILLAKALDAYVDIVSVMESPKTDNEIVNKEEYEKKIRSVVNQISENNINCKSHILIQGLTPGETIVNYAVENDVDQIIIGVDRLSRVGKILMGSVAQYVILQAPCPVLTVKNTMHS